MLSAFPPIRSTTPFLSGKYIAFLHAFHYPRLPQLGKRAVNEFEKRGEGRISSGSCSSISSTSSTSGTILVVGVAVCDQQFLCPRPVIGAKALLSNWKVRFSTRISVTFELKPFSILLVFGARDYSSLI